MLGGGHRGSSVDSDLPSLDLYSQQDVSEFIINFFQQMQDALSSLSSLSSLATDNNSSSSINSNNSSNSSSRSSSSGSSSSVKTLVQDFFGGVLQNSLHVNDSSSTPGTDRSTSTSTSPALLSTRDEAFFCLPLEVSSSSSSSSSNGCVSLTDSLARFMRPEVVDYRWHGETASRPTIKTTAVKSLPPHLLLHLKRFEFDFSAMVQVKLNCRFEFPLQLDMAPYMIAGGGGGGSGGGGGGSCMYDLRGVVMTTTIIMNPRLCHLIDLLIDGLILHHVCASRWCTLGRRHLVTTTGGWFNDIIIMR